MGLERHDRNAAPRRSPDRSPRRFAVTGNSKVTATSPTDVHVEWDPNVTVDDGRFYHQGKDTDFSVPALSTIVAEALGIADDSGSTDSALQDRQHRCLSKSLTPSWTSLASRRLAELDQRHEPARLVPEPDTAQHLHATDPEMSRTYDCAYITDVWWMNMGGGIPADVLTEFERIVDQMGQQ